MEVAILEYIGNTIKNNNSFFDTFRVNGIQLPGGEVVEFSDHKEKEFIGIGDNFGTAFYIRSNPVISYPGERRLSSKRQSVSAVKQCRLVAFSWDMELSSEGLMNKMETDLRSIKFSNFESSRKPSITIKKSNRNYLDNAKEELKKELKDIPQEFICVSIDFELKYYPAECDECFSESEPSCNYDF